MGAGGGGGNQFDGMSSGTYMQGGGGHNFENASSGTYMGAGGAGGNQFDGMSSGTYMQAAQAKQFNDSDDDSEFIRKDPSEQQPLDKQTTLMMGGFDDFDMPRGTIDNKK